MVGLGFSVYVRVCVRVCVCVCVHVCVCVCVYPPQKYIPVN